MGCGFLGGPQQVFATRRRLSHPQLEVVVSLDAERPSHCPHRWLGPWPLAVPTRASPQCLTRTHAPQSGCMAVLGYRCTAFNWGAISRPQASYTGLHPTDARSKSEYSLTHSLTHSLTDWAVAWSITARFVLGYLSVAWERGRSAAAQLYTHVLL